MREVDEKQEISLLWPKGLVNPKALSDICTNKKIVIERTRDLIYPKFVATDFFPKIIGRAKRAPHWGVQSRFRVIYSYSFLHE